MQSGAVEACGAMMMRHEESDIRESCSRMMTDPNSPTVAFEKMTPNSVSWSDLGRCESGTRGHVAMR